MSSHTLGKFECIMSKHLDELDSYSFSGNKPEKHMTSTCSSFHFNDFMHLCISQEESVNSLQSTLHYLIFIDHNHYIYS